MPSRRPSTLLERNLTVATPRTISDIHIGRRHYAVTPPAALLPGRDYRLELYPETLTAEIHEEAPDA